MCPWADLGSCELLQILPNQQLIEQEPPFASSETIIMTMTVDKGHQHERAAGKNASAAKERKQQTLIEICLCLVSSSQLRIPLGKHSNNDKYAWIGKVRHQAPGESIPNPPSRFDRQKGRKIERRGGERSCSSKLNSKSRKQRSSIRNPHQMESAEPWQTTSPIKNLP